MNDISENHAPTPQEEGNGLIFDHPLLDKLSMMDRIVVTAHYAALVQAAVTNTRLMELCRIINTLTLVIETSTTFSDEQKQALVGLAYHLQGRMNEIVASHDQETEEN